MTPSLPHGSAVQFSPDQKWLSIISNENEVLLYRLTYDDSSVEVARKPNKLARQKRSADTSALVTYRRAITRQQFSADSKVLVVSDLSGFIDCWRLGLHEVDADVEMKDEDDSSSDDSSSEDEEEDASDGQTWELMDSAKALPQLDSGALVLSFRPGRKTKIAQTNGVKKDKQINGTSGDIQNTANEVVYQPNDKYELFILTGSHNLHEFDLSTGKLTDWSRRNTSDRLPETFRKIKDRTMDCHWHVRSEAQRLYLYGSNFLYMLDVDKDFEIEKDAEAGAEASLIERPNKRKWEGESGAGDRKKDSAYVGFKPGMTITENGEASAKKIKQEQTPQKQVKAEEDDDEDEDEEDDDEDPHASMSLRKPTVIERVVEQGPRKSWYSFAYRPILTVFPLESTEEYIETVVVERPYWELNLPPRLAGPHEKTK